MGPGELSWNHPTSETSQSSSTQTYTHIHTDNYLHLLNRTGMRSGRMWLEALAKHVFSLSKVVLDLNTCLVYICVKHCSLLRN